MKKCTKCGMYYNMGVLEMLYDELRDRTFESIELLCEKCKEKEKNNDLS